MVIAAAVAVAGALAAVHYHSLGLTLAHYDARAHLVVARRILDSLTPGWQQIGAVWLPLPHVLNMIPVQVDTWYRTGASGVAISVLAMAVGAGSLASLVQRLTGSFAAAIAGATLLLLNPNVLYLQSTPMTEPLLFGLSLLSVATTASWLDGSPGKASSAAPGITLAALCMTRYEGWAITAAIVSLAFVILLVRMRDGGAAFAVAVRLGIWPFVAVAVFTLNSRWVVGAWFVSGDFFVPENTEALGAPFVAWRQVRRGLEEMAGTALPLAGYAGVALLAWTAARRRERSSLILLVALYAAAMLPVLAYTRGHPFRIRYDLPLVVAAAAAASAAIGILPSLLRLPAAAALIALSAWQAPPLDSHAPMVVESQREAANMAGRRVLTTYLQAHYDGTGIMMSMGSLGHYMHDLSLAGFRIKDFLHEGNGEIWRFAMLQPRGHAGWLVVEGTAEGGDALHHAAQWPRWLAGFELVAEGGGARLYRATAQVDR